MNMKKLKYKGIFSVVMMAVALSSCDKGYKALNVNPDATSTPTPQYVFTLAEYDGAGYGGHYGSSAADFLLGTMQYTTSYNDVAGFGSKYINSQVQQTGSPFNAAYPDEIN